MLFNETFVEPKIVQKSNLLLLFLSYFSLRTPKLECQLRFSSKDSAESIIARSEDTIVLDTIDDSIALVICKEKDCIVRLKKPIFVSLTFLNTIKLIGIKNNSRRSDTYIDRRRILNNRICFALQVKKGNYNEIALTFPPTSLIDDILLIKGNAHKAD